MDDNGEQLARLIYHRWMSSMKYTLELEEFSYRERGRSDPKYKTFKKHLMSNSYENLRSLFKDLSDCGIIKKTEYTEDVKDGYKDSSSGGSGYLNTERFDAWLNIDG